MTISFSKQFVVVATLMVGYVLSAVDACFNCKNEKKVIENSFDNKETSKIFFRSFTPEQKLRWAHQQTVGEKKAGRKDVEPTDHNYNTMMLAVSKGLERPYRALYRTRSRNQEIWNANEGTQHVQALKQHSRKENSMIGRIKKLLPHKSYKYQRIIESSSRSDHPSPKASSEESSGKSARPSEMKQHIRLSQSPQAREKVKSWLAGIPDSLCTSKDVSSHQRDERISGKTPISTHMRAPSSPRTSQESANSAHDRPRSSSPPSRAYSHVSSSIDSHANVHVHNPHIESKVLHNSQKKTL